MVNRSRQYARLSTGRKAAIREEACTWLNKLYFRRDEFLTGDASPEEVVRKAADIIIREFFGYEILKPPEILTTRFGFQTAGVIDRTANTVTIAQNFKLEYRRFTTSHELGHLVLHPAITYHRDRPLDGSDEDYRKPKEELEADLFGAEFLMPTNLLRKVFTACFGGPIVGGEADENVCYYLGTAVGRRLSPKDFRKLTVLDRAKLVSSVSDFATNRFESLESRFMVSRTAMAIQLRDLKLVT
ncbi:MAG: ImmA/IrrE family metallo-endopeptidase [Planctomycetaceae bacterium]